MTESELEKKKGDKHDSQVPSLSNRWTEELLTEIVFEDVGVLPGSLYRPLNPSAKYQKMALSHIESSSCLRQEVTPPDLQLMTNRYRGTKGWLFCFKVGLVLWDPSCSRDT